MSKRSSLLDDSDRDPETGNPEDGEGTAYGTGGEADDAYLSVNGGATHSPSSKLGRCKAWFQGLSGKQWLIVAGVVIVIALIGLMAHHKPPHPAPHDPHASGAPAGAAEIEIASSVHHVGEVDHGHGEHISPDAHSEHQWAGDHQQPQHHEAGGAAHHPAKQHVGVVHVPDMEVPPGFEEVEGQQSAPIPGDDMAHADALAHEHGPDPVHAGGLHAPRIVHPRGAGHTGGEYEPQHTVHDSVAVLATGGDIPLGHAGDGHHGPHIVETHMPADVDIGHWSQWYEDVHDVRWFHVLRDVHVWRVFGMWENGKGQPEIGFHFTSWKPTDYEQVRHGLGIHRTWQPMNELSLLTLRAHPAPLSEHDHAHEHAHIDAHDQPTIIGIGAARPTIEPASAVHHETQGTHLPGGEPVIMLYTPAHWSHQQATLYAHRVLRVHSRHALPHHTAHHAAAHHTAAADGHHPQQTHEQHVQQLHEHQTQHHEQWAHHEQAGQHHAGGFSEEHHETAGHHDDAAEHHAGGFAEDHHESGHDSEHHDADHHDAEHHE